MTMKIPCRFAPRAAAYLLSGLMLATLAFTAGAAELTVPAAAEWHKDFDVDKATQAWIDTLPAAARARSDAYFEGGYWLQVWGLLWSLAVAAWWLMGKRAARLRDLIGRHAGGPWRQAAVFAAIFLVVSWVLTLPLDIYQNWYRERQYELATQTFLPWFGEQLLSLAIDVLIGAPVIATIYAAVRRAREHAWVWASGIVTAVIIVLVALSPVFIAPLFNDYKPLEAGPVRDQILSLARANGVPADNVYRFDASRQTTRISANVSGALGTTRISLNDNLLEHTSLPEIRAVMAHEMGHYVLHHGWKTIIGYALVIALLLYLLQRILSRFVARRGARFGIYDRGDIAGLPLAMAILSVLGFLATPVFNNITRVFESEADIFGLNAAGEPEGFASVAMRLSTYRKISPGPIEEVIFYDHPSGHTRVQMAMRWLAEHPPASTR
ncbi:MAG: M48 family metallopeptidase [Steroidobacteraceae bacterium]